MKAAGTLLVVLVHAAAPSPWLPPNLQEARGGATRESSGPVEVSPYQGEREDDHESDTDGSESFDWLLDDIDAAIAAERGELARTILNELASGFDGLGLNSEEMRVRALVGLISRAKQLGSLDAKRVLQEALLETRSRLQSPDHPDLVAGKIELALTWKELGNLEGARELEEEVLETLAPLRPADHRDLLAAKLNLGVTKFQLGQLSNACQLFEEVLEAWTRLLPENHPDLLTAKENLAGTKHLLGAFASARELQEEVLEARRSNLPADHTDLLSAQGNLAMMKRAMGELVDARELEEAVLEAQTRLLPPDHPDILQAKHNLAMTKSVLGDLVGARELQEEVLEARRRTLSKEHYDLLAAKGNLAATMSSLGDLAGARELQEEVREAWGRLLPEDHPDLLFAKQNLAVTSLRLGDFAGACKLFEEVLAVRIQVLPEGHHDLLAAKQNLAVTKYSLGDLVGARKLKEEVLETWKVILNEDHPDLLRAKHNLAITKKALGDLGGARELQEQVLEARMDFLSADHPDLLAARQNLARTKGRLGDLKGARELLASLLEGMRVKARSLRADSPRTAREGARSELSRLLDPTNSSLAISSETDLASVYFEILEELRAVSVAGPDILHSLTDRLELAELRDRTLEMRAKIQNLAVSPPTEPGALEAWRSELAALAQERDGLEFSLRSELAKTGMFTGGIKLEDIAERLEHGDVAVSFLRSQRLREEQPDPDEARSTVESFFAFIVRPNATVERIDLGAAAEIEELVCNWRASIGQPLEGRGIGGEVDGELPPPGDGSESGLALCQRLLRPIIQRLGGKPPNVLYLVLDDVLHLAPVDALPLDDDAYVGDRIEVRSEVSFQRLVAPRRAPGAARSLVALGDVNFDEVVRPTGEDDSDVSKEPLPKLSASLSDAMTPPVSNRSGSLKALRRLPATLEEIQLIGAQFEESSGIKPMLIDGVEATKGALVSAASDARFLHVATHGWFAPEKFKSQLDTITDERMRGLFERAHETLIGLAPETLCGLALAGANLGPDAVGRVPGIITAEELSMLDLRNCELAVLSACETNVGIRRAGQGIQSLQTALHAAGARTAITSLWRVDDAATSSLMELFYTKLWTDGLGKADALWQAKVALREEGHPVRDWAGWVLTGDPE